MPVCFQLMRKTAPDVPVVLTDIDAEMCEHFQVPVDKVKWFYSWYNWLGFGLATGRTFDQLAADHDNDPQALEILAWVRENFVHDSWREQKHG